MNEDLSRKILSDIIIYMKYAKYLPSKKRRENWEEIVDRNKNMHIKKYPKLKVEIEEAYSLVYEKKILPSMRGLQFGGRAIDLNPVRSFNCSARNIDDPIAFKEVMFLLLSGAGVGISVQLHHVEKLPEIYKPKKKRRYLIADSIEGWAEAVGALVEAYMGNRKSLPVFDFSDIRAKGTPLKTSGGKAPGSDDLKVCLLQVQNILDSKKDGEKLTTLECLDMCCHIATCVVSGGIRRSSMLALFSFTDSAVKTCKANDWVSNNPQRAMVNISAAILRHKIKESEFYDYAEYMKNGFGEPGIFWTNNSQTYLTNPCGEASLKSGSFCNLTSINTTDIKDQEDFNNRARMAARIGTLQAGYTNFHLLGENWQEQTEEDALLGVSLAGIATGKVLDLDIKEAAREILYENEKIAEMIGIKKANRACLEKPDGTVSSLLGCSSGIHAWHSPYYIRRIRVLKEEPIYQYLKEQIPELIEDDKMKHNIQAIISIPIKSPEDAIFRNETALQLLRRVRKLYRNWVLAGHREGQNTHSISCTVSVKSHEWGKVGRWLWENKDHYASIAVFPYDDSTYIQAPFEEINKEIYEDMYKKLKQIDLTKIKENKDNTKLKENIACSGGTCEIV